MLAFAAVPPALQVPMGTCAGDLTVLLPERAATAQAGTVCSGSVTVTATPFALRVPSGACEGEMTVPGVGIAHISADDPTIAFTTDPAPILTVNGPNLTVAVSLVGGLTQQVQCSSAVIFDFSQDPPLTVPQSLCTTT